MICEISEINPSDAGKFAEVIHSPNSDTVDLSDAISSEIHAKFHVVLKCQNVADLLVLSMVGRGGQTQHPSRPRGVSSFAARCCFLPSWH